MSRPRPHPRRRKRLALTLATLAVGVANIAVVLGLARPRETTLASNSDNAGGASHNETPAGPLPPWTLAPVAPSEMALPTTTTTTTTTTATTATATTATGAPAPPGPVVTGRDGRAGASETSPIGTGVVAAAQRSYYMVRVITFYGNADGRSRAEAVRGFFESQGWHPVVARRASGYWVVEVGRYPSWGGAEHTRKSLRTIDHPQASFRTAIVLHRTVPATHLRD